MHLPQRRRLRQSRILFFFSGVLLCCVYTLTLKASLSDPWTSPQTAEDPEKEEYSRVPNVESPEVDFSNATEDNTDLPTSATAPLVITVNRTDLEQCIYVEPEPPKPPLTDPPPTTTSKPADAPHRTGEYPNDLFSVEQRREGWVVLHILGMIYMFVSLAIVCDEFFVPTLEVITNKLEISDDVAGATFMAAGGSAPELFTSLIGVFISHSNVGIGTIVGSAVFNILFVIGMCAVFSREMLHLTWWPLFRDVSFYILDLSMLIIFFLDNTIVWWESMMLVSGYVAYVTFMKFNVQIENAVKTQLYKHVSVVKVITVGEPEKESEPLPPPPPPPPVEPPSSPPESEQSNTKPSNLPCESQSDTTKLKVRPILQRGGSSASLHNTSMRSTIFQLMIHTLDPLAEGAILRGDRKAPASNRVRRDGNLKADLKSDQTNSVSVQVTHPPEPTTSKPPKAEDKSEKKTDQPDNPKDKDTTGDCGSNGSGGSKKDNSEDDSNDEEDDDEEENEEEEGEEEEEVEEEEEEIEEPLTLKWPDSRRKQATYLLLLPIVLPLWLTVPDVRNPASKRYFVGTFIGSIIWIAVFSYLMVWWAHQVGETIGISEEIMGLTILAAGTSIPDLITSVIVARKGLGDMAVSSSVGSNIFDITMGLPVPWLMFSLYHGGEAITVSSNGLFCAIVLLFIMLLFVIFSIAACRWKMSRMLGFTMFVLYFVFLVLSVLLEDRVLICPVSI